HCLQFLERPAIGNVRTADEVEIPVITQAKICRQPVRNFPVVLEVQAKLLRVLNDERGITHGNAHAVDYFGLSEAAGGQDLAWQLVKVDLQRRVELEEAAHKRRPDVVESGPQGVLADGLAYVILELVLALNRVLRNVGVGSE